MTEYKLDLSTLDEISPEMRKRLAVMIERDYPNFVLVGSDPAEEGGCCPSNEVGHANALVASGILESWQAGCGKNACPGTFYAFRGEKVPDTRPPEFKVNEELRVRVAERLKTSSPRVLIRETVKVLLLLFVAACIGILAVRAFREKEGILATSLVLMEVKNGSVVRRKVLDEAWQMIQDKGAFVQMVTDELEEFMTGQQ